MTIRPILFSPAMVRALLERTKTQTRRVLNPQPFPVGGPFYRPCPKTNPFEWHSVSASGHTCNIQTVRYAPGDLLYVRENFSRVPVTAYRGSEGVFQTEDPNDRDMACVYSAGWDRSKPGAWKPGIHMPRWASRLSLKVTDVRVQRVQEISEGDAEAEGVSAIGADNAPEELSDFRSFVWAFHQLWDSLNDKRSFGWDMNPWVVAITFEVHHCNVDQFERAAA